MTTRSSLTAKDGRQIQLLGQTADLLSRQLGASGGSLISPGQRTSRTTDDTPHGLCDETPPGSSRDARRVHRGLSAQLSTAALQSSSRLMALTMLNRFRVMRTIDVAVLCYPERPFKAALTAAQRAVRGMVKDQLIKRYKTDRFQTIYALTAKGADWLRERGVEDAESSVRRASDMTNPEHRLWLQLLVLAAEARGVRAETEQELLRRLNRGTDPMREAIQGLLTVNVYVDGRVARRTLRPDALLAEEGGATWIEVDRSKRGSDRDASLRALVLSLGAQLKDATTLRRVVVFCKSERIQGRALALLRGLVRQSVEQPLGAARRSVREIRPGTFEVHADQTQTLSDGRIMDRPVKMGHVIVQQLPVWLPKARIDSRNAFSDEGWLDKDYLPYRRASVGPPWNAPLSPLLGMSMKS